MQKGVIAEEIRNFKPSTPIRVALELDPTDINNKIKAYKSQAPAEIPAKLKLNVKDVGAQLRRYKLTVPIKLAVTELNTSDIDEKIRAYRAKSSIKVGVSLDGSSINEQIKKYKILVSYFQTIFYIYYLKNNQLNMYYQLPLELQ